MKAVTKAHQHIQLLYECLSQWIDTSYTTYCGGFAMKNQQLHLCFQGEDIAYKVVMPAIRSYLMAVNFESAGMVEIAISEAVANAMRASCGKFVNVDLCMSDSHDLYVRIRDHGNGFDVESAMAQLDQWDSEIPGDSLYAESGRGLFVIRQVFDMVRFNQPGNELLLVKSHAS